jgi:hypothetical protein
LGYNQSTSLQIVDFPSVKKLAIPKVDQVPTPQNLKDSFPKHELTQLFELKLNSKHVLKKDYFILVFTFLLVFKIIIMYPSSIKPQIQENWIRSFPYCLNCASADQVWLAIQHCFCRLDTTFAGSCPCASATCEAGSLL